MIYPIHGLRNSCMHLVGLLWSNLRRSQQHYRSLRQNLGLGKPNLDTENSWDMDHGTLSYMISKIMYSQVVTFASKNYDALKPIKYI